MKSNVQKSIQKSAKFQTEGDSLDSHGKPYSKTKAKQTKTGKDYGGLKK